MHTRLQIGIASKHKAGRSFWPIAISIFVGITLANLISGKSGFAVITAAVLGGIAFATAVFALFQDSPEIDERAELNRMRAADALLKAIIGIVATMGGYLVGTRTGTLLIAAATGILAIWGILILYFNWRDTH